jgi:hypothetical protein
VGVVVARGGDQDDALGARPCSASPNLGVLVVGCVTALLLGRRRPQAVPTPLMLPAVARGTNVFARAAIPADVFWCGVVVTRSPAFSGGYVVGRPDARRDRSC